MSFELHHSMENDKWYNKKSFDLAFHFSFNQNKLWTNWRSNREGSFIQQTQYFIPVEIDLSVVPARLGIWLFHLSRRKTVIQDLLSDVSVHWYRTIGCQLPSCNHLIFTDANISQHVSIQRLFYLSGQTNVGYIYST